MTSKLLTLGAEFIGITEEEFKKRIDDNPQRAIDDWKKYGIGEYDKYTDANIYGLVGFNDDERIENLTYFIKNISGKKVLDFGGGIGTISRALEDNGNEVFYYDVPSRTQDFAKFVSEKLKYKTVFLNKEEISLKKYDIIITADVLEHLKNPMLYVKLLDSFLVSGGTWITTGLNFSVGEHTPMHLFENTNYIKEHNEFFNNYYNMLYLHVTKKEIIYGCVKK
jgi:2-polyprenyl-3-methyl-5-hydroxy-6-metoxy-1,4-benzoquinol methylase